MLIRCLLLVALSLCFSTALGQSKNREPHIGYLYPAGGQRGSVVKIIAGGQLLREASEIRVSGKGVRGKIVQLFKPRRDLTKEQRQLLRARLEEIWKKRLLELPEKERKLLSYPKRKPAKKKPQKAKEKKEDKKTKNNVAAKGKKASKPEEVKLPDHPLLFDFDNKSFKELSHITDFFFHSRWKRQPNQQIAQLALIEIAIDSNAKPGDRELRIKTPRGLTNPIIFQVGDLPELRELEPNNQNAFPKVYNMPTTPKGKPFDLPALINGQIMPGDVDRFRFRAKKGQTLMMRAHARSLIPYLADAVPGWFQATLTLYDAKGNELAFADDGHFDPDPVLCYRVPKNGEYELGIRDSIYRGRQDFVYRVEVRAVKQAPRTLKKFMGAPAILNKLPGCNEKEPNNTAKSAQKINIPKIINGRIDLPGDIDVFQFKGQAGNKVVLEAFGRRLNSPMDSLLRLSDASGKVLKWNDDYVLKENHLHKNANGLITHHADSYLVAELPKTGTYYAQISDAQHHGGKAYAYRLRISAPQPDFALRVTPSSLAMQPGAAVPVCVYALRKDGFNGRIDLKLKGSGNNFKLNGGSIPAGSNYARMTLTAPGKKQNRLIAIQLEGSAQINGKTVRRKADPADNVMQAFLYRHLAPARELVAAIVPKSQRRRLPNVKLSVKPPIQIPVGGSTKVKIKIKRKPHFLKEVQLILFEPPKGVSLENLAVAPEGLEFQLKANDLAQAGFDGNLIVEAFREYVPKPKKGKPAKKKKHRYSLGILPAIPIKIIKTIKK